MSGDTPEVSAELTCVLCKRHWIENDDDNAVKYTGILRDHCPDCRVESTNRIWTMATSWRMLVALGAWFVSGKLWCTASHVGPLCEESAELIPGLKRLHEYGLLTVHSQPFERLIFAHEPLEHETHTGRKFFECKQRPWLYFVIPTRHPDIPKDKILSLVRSFLVHPFMNASIWSNFDEYPPAEELTGLQTVAPLHNTDDLYLFRTSHTEEENPIITKYRMADTEADLLNSEYEGEFDCPGRFPDGGHLYFRYFVSQYPPWNPSYLMARGMKTLTVHVWAKRWDERIDVPALVEQACIDAGLKPIFEGINEWTSVESDDDLLRLVLGEDRIGYESKTPGSTEWKAVDLCRGLCAARTG